QAQLVGDTAARGGVEDGPPFLGEAPDQLGLPHTAAPPDDSQGSCSAGVPPALEPPDLLLPVDEHTGRVTYVQRSLQARSPTPNVGYPLALAPAPWARPGQPT